AVPPPQALGQLAAYFADPDGLSRAVTANFLGAVREQEAAFRAHLEATVAEIGTEERALRENTRPGAIALLVAGGFFAGVALLWIAAGLPGLSADQARLVVAVALACGTILAGFGAFRLWRGERTTMILRPEAMAIPGLDRPIPWDSVADLDMTLGRTGVVTRLLLPPEAPFPQRVPGGRKVKLDARRCIVTITAGLPRKMTVQDFADLIGRYRHAAEARRILAGTEVSSARPANTDIPISVRPAP
ncbi:peptidase M48, partial [Methylobacterium sp. WL103]